jgi:hypothetical protein
LCGAYFVENHSQLTAGKDARCVGRRASMPNEYHCGH